MPGSTNSVLRYRWARAAPTARGIALARHASRGSAAVRPGPFPLCVAVVRSGNPASRRRPGVNVCRQVAHQIPETVKHRPLARPAILLERARRDAEPFGGLGRGEKHRCRYPMSFSFSFSARPRTIPGHTYGNPTVNSTGGGGRFAIFENDPPLCCRARFPIHRVRRIAPRPSRQTCQCLQPLDRLHRPGPERKPQHQPGRHSGFESGMHRPRPQANLRRFRTVFNLENQRPVGEPQPRQARAGVCKQRREWRRSRLLHSHAVSPCGGVSRRGFSPLRPARRHSRLPAQRAAKLYGVFRIRARKALAQAQLEPRVEAQARGERHAQAKRPARSVGGLHTDEGHPTAHGPCARQARTAARPGSVAPCRTPRSSPAPRRPGGSTATARRSVSRPRPNRAASTTRARPPTGCRRSNR